MDVPSPDWFEEHLPRSDRESSGSPFDLAVFDQGDWWQTPDGQVHRISDLHEDYKEELVGWLMAEAFHFFTDISVRELLVAARTELEDGRSDADDRRVTRLAAALWMQDTPLVRALTRPA